MRKFALLFSVVLMGSSSVLAETTEIPRITTIDSSGTVGQYASIGQDSSGHLAVAYRDSTNSAFKLWLDDGRGSGTANDGVANGTELRTIGSSEAMQSSIGLDRNGRLAISYYDSSTYDLML